MAVRNQSHEVLFGNFISPSVSTQYSKNNLGVISGRTADGSPRGLFLNYELFSKHLLLLGGIGTGKTNTFFHLTSQIEKTMDKDDVMVIFDTKGDFYQEFYCPGDVVISNDETACGPDCENYWNIFAEIYYGPHMMENIMEISRMLFAEACEKTTQLFFPAAARDIFAAILEYFVTALPPERRTNRYLVEYINHCTSQDLRKMLLSMPSTRALSSYISMDESPQTQGVLSELLQVTRQLFAGNFAKHGNLGIQELVSQKKSRKIFIEYDLSMGKTLSPIYSLLFDLAIKKSLSRSRTKGNVYFITDEFRLLPYLEHIDDAVNFGRSMGVKFLVGIQNVEQIYDNYGEERARSIMSGFSTTMAFRVNDAKSREYIKDLFGKNIKLERYLPTISTRGMIEEKREAYVVEDWDISNLRTGEAIIGFPGECPFLFQFDLYQERG